MKIFEQMVSVLEKCIDDTGIAEVRYHLPGVKSVSAGGS